jgi:hypothetical protein
LHVIDSSGSCGSNEQLLCWNQIGPKGNSSLATVSTVPAGDPSCATGGSKLSVGVDANGDGQLDAAEVTGFTYVCNGATGPAGPQGAAGTNGTSCSVTDNGDGTKTIACADGTKVTVSDGPQGAVGATGAQGPAGPQGVAGGAGASGSQLQLTPEPPGPNCTAGGERIDIGVAADGGFEIQQPLYVCNGAFQQPAGTVAVSFSVDDGINQVFTQGDLRWKGAMRYDASSRTFTGDPTWKGPFAPLYDDGPWNQVNPLTTQPGHEPIGSTAGDHIWGVTAFVAAPEAGTVSYGYGLIDHACGDGWIWVGENGMFSVAAGSGPITAAGMTFAKFGTVDLEVAVDTSQLDSRSTWDTSRVALKGSAWAWQEVQLTDDGSGKFVFTLSNVVGPGHADPHAGLLHSGDTPEWVFVFNGREYKVLGGVPSIAGITARTKAQGADTWTSAVVGSDWKGATITVP